MGKKAVGRSRRRHQKENATVDAVLDGAAKAAAEERALGTAVSAKTDNASLFVMDRTAVPKSEVKEQVRKQTLADLREKRRERPNRAELSLENKTKVSAVLPHIPGRKKQHEVGGVESALLGKRSFKRRKRAPKAPGFRMDVWGADVASAEPTKKSGERMRIEKKMNAAVRSSKSVLKPGDGLSVNPAYEAHQDALGEATAGIMNEKLDDQIAKKKMSFDPAILKVCEEEERKFAEEEAKADKDMEVEESSDEGEMLMRKLPERKTRTMRNREKRRKASDIKRGFKIARRRMRRDLENLEAIAEEAVREADKINGETKRRELEANPPLPRAEGAPLHKEIAKEKVRTEAKSVPVPLSDDLSMNMRNVKMPQSNSVLRDRFLSFERRGIVEPTGVLKKEARQAAQAKRAHELRERRPRKNFRGSRSNISYWRQGGKVRKC